MRKMVVASKEALGDAATVSCGDLWRDVDSGEVVVSSIRTGMKREFAMMMKAQLEMGELAVGQRRVTRSQSAGSSGQGRTRSGRKMFEKVQKSSTKRIRRDKGDKLSENAVGKLEIDDVVDSNGENLGDNAAAKLEIVDVADCDEGDKLGENAVGKLEIVDVVDCEEGDKLYENAVEKLEIVDVADCDEGDKFGENAVGKLVIVDIAVSDEGKTKENLPAAGTDVVGDLRTAKAVTVDTERSVREKSDSNLTENFEQPLSSESPLPQAGGNDVELRGEDRTSGGASHLRCEMVGKAVNELSEKPTRRFTRSALKLQDEAIRSPLDPTAVKNEDAETSNTSPLKLEMKMSKKVELKKVPTKLKDLLQTGLLEGLRVRYVRPSKGRGRPEPDLHGIIRGPGILCLCCECRGGKVVTPNQFELHAHSGNKHPPENIFLENGKSLRDVLSACKNDCSDSLEKVIQDAIGCANPRMNAFCLSCKGMIPESSANRSMPLCDSCEPTKSDYRAPQTSNTSCHRSPLVDSHAPVASNIQLEVSEGAGGSSNVELQVKCLGKIVQKSPLVDSHAQVASNIQLEASSNGRSQVKRKGKLTRKDLGMHKLVFTENVLPDGAVLHYVLQGEKKLEGFKKGGGIFCSCCDNVVSPSQFEAHAGFSSRRKPYDNIYMSNGVSLHELALKLSENRKSSTDENDDLCSICEDGGDLLCCEQCPRAFHPECVGLESIPQDAWHCQYCQNMRQKERFAERNPNAIAAGRVAGVDPLNDLRCVRVVASFESYVGGCAICREHNFSTSEFSDHTVIICDQCEKEYHVGCLRDQNIDHLQEVPQGDWFCSRQCSDISSVLQRYTNDGEMILPEALLDIIKQKCLGDDLEQAPEVDVRWRLLRGKTSSESIRKWLSGAVSIFHDQFAPVADASTDSRDLIPDIVYGRPFKDHDFAGMYCALLIVNSVIMSVAIFRIFGEEVAELPLVATKKECEGKGYFQVLFSCFENLLSSLRVKDLVLPAAGNAESLWKKRFGFEKLGHEQLKEYKNKYQMLIFEGTSVLHKTIT